MNLFRKQIVGNIFSGDTISGVFPYQFNTETTISGWDNITSIENLHTYGEKTTYDYKVVRDEIKGLFVNPWSAYTSEGARYIFCVHKIGSQVERNSRVGVGNAILLGLQYQEKMSKVREIRVAYVTTEIHSRLPMTGSMLDVARESILDYLIFGREGTVQGDNEGITDYLNSVVGTGYETTGMSSQSWTPIGLTFPQLITKIEDIILKGIY